MVERKKCEVLIGVCTKGMDSGQREVMRMWLTRGARGKGGDEGIRKKKRRIRGFFFSLFILVCRPDQGESTKRINHHGFCH